MRTPCANDRIAETPRLDTWTVGDMIRPRRDPLSGRRGDCWRTPCFRAIQCMPRTANVSVVIQRDEIHGTINAFEQMDTSLMRGISDRYLETFKTTLCRFQSEMYIETSNGRILNSFSSSHGLKTFPSQPFSFQCLFF